ncbi:hypothetical protein F2Q70_00012178 [Brassica cretica]|uniref:Uncharacterized protein n=1 Tax=Brassica cretica TaxID=69181 RepID=A0A8S9LYF5_BRACR|nr:hypothetical protein F2Q70_00012178 [Brassica cretica]
MITTCGVTHRSTRWNGQVRGVAIYTTRPCGQTCGGRGVTLHVSRPCIQTGRGRGVTFHHLEKVLFKCREISSSVDQFKISLDVGLLEKVEEGFRSQKSGLGSRPRSTKNNLVPSGFKETPYSLDREDPDERGHVLWLSITQRCNVAVTRRTVDCRAVGVPIYRRQQPITIRLVAARVSLCMAPVACAAAPRAPHGGQHDQDVMQGDTTSSTCLICGLVACRSTPHRPHVDQHFSIADTATSRASA